MKATVVIPTKNPGSHFKTVLNTVLRQKTPWQYEIIVIDSGSSDGTLEYCQQFRDRVQLVEIPPEEFGHGKTRNAAAAMSQGDFVAFLTHDALPKDETWLYNIVAAMEESESIAGAFGRHIPYPNGNPFVARDLNNHFDNFRNGPKISKIDDWTAYRSDVTSRQKLHFFSNNNSCIKRSVLLEIPFPEVDFAEDQVWASAMLEAGYSKVYVDNAIVFHSHDYTPVELFKRSIDESRALARLFGYNLCPSLRQVIFQTLKLTARDIKFALREGLLVDQFYWVCLSGPLNLARQLGFYIGQRLAGRPDNEILLEKLSLDYALKLGKRKVGS